MELAEKGKCQNNRTISPLRIYDKKGEPEVYEVALSNV